MQIEHISQNEFELLKHKIDTDLTWTYPDNNYMYKVIENNKLLALIAFKESLSECSDKIFIDNFFIFEKNKGNGIRIVDYLKEMFSEIELFPTPDSLKFWYNRDFVRTNNSGDNYIWKK